MTAALAEELREYTAMKYAGDCKCGKCQLVPRNLVERIYHALNSANVSLSPQQRCEPNHVYDPDDWECTMPWQDRDQLAEDSEVQFQGIKRFKTLINGPDKYCVFVGDCFEWLDTKSEAEAAFSSAQGATDA